MAKQRSIESDEIREASVYAKRLNAVLNTAIDAIITIDGSGSITDINKATVRMFGYGRDELIGSNVRMLMPSPYREQHDGYLASYHQTGVKKIIGFGREVIGRRKDGTHFPVDLAVTEVSGFNLFTGIIRDISRRKALEQRLLSAHDEERRFLARELHDGVAGYMTGIGLLAKGLQTRLERADSSEAKNVAELVGYIHQAHEELRHLSHELMPTQIQPDSFVRELEALARQYDSGSPVTCRFQCSDPVHLAVEPDICTHLYRIAQEAVSNAMRHAKASEITIKLTQTTDAISLCVEDDGIGIQGKSHGRDALGLDNMGYRAGLIGALFIMTAPAGGGTKVICTLPITQNH